MSRDCHGKNVRSRVIHFWLDGVIPRLLTMEKSTFSVEDSVTILTIFLFSIPRKTPSKTKKFHLTIYRNLEEDLALALSVAACWCSVVSIKTTIMTCISSMWAFVQTSPQKSLKITMTFWSLSTLKRKVTPAFWQPKTSHFSSRKTGFPKTSAAFHACKISWPPLMERKVKRNWEKSLKIYLKVMVLLKSFSMSLDISPH